MLCHALCALAVLAPASTTDPLVGRASVIDGDTVEIRGRRIRLWGIDAPERRQTCTKDGEIYRCGQTSATNLTDLVQNYPVTCVPKARPDRYRRIIATCTVTVPPGEGPGQLAGSSNTHDLGAWQVLSGYAQDWPLYSGGAYLIHEALAEELEAGMWSGEFQKPWEWRCR